MFIQKQTDRTSAVADDGSVMCEARSANDSGSLPRAGSVLIVDDQVPFVQQLTCVLRAQGYDVWTCQDFAHVAHAIEISRPTHVLSELRIGTRRLVDEMKHFGRSFRVEQLVVITNYPSIATAVSFARLGVAGYMAKPAPPPAVLNVLRDAPDFEAPSGDVNEDVESWPSLNRVVWEYLSQVYVSAGSIAGAARRLGLDRRSLRRMLAKYPPAR